ncbi:MAG: isochorismatase family protein [Betaproteobacteria bacterium]|nr:isochorismatase family protein [Betaproteobacteria bacterium]
MTAAQTLRSMGGATAPSRVDPAHTALLLIDFQKEYYSGALPLPDGEAAARNAAQLVDWADRVGVQVVHVHHVAPSAKAPLFTPGTDRVAPHGLVTPRPGHQCITKTLPSSFVNTNLDATLKEKGIDTLIVTGLMTHMCVDSTARDAVSLGYKTIVAGDACATRDLPERGIGAAIPHREIHRASLTALADRFADVLASAEVQRLA